LAKPFLDLTEQIEQTIYHTYMIHAVWVSMAPVEPLRDCQLIVVGHTAFLFSSSFLL